MLRSLKLGMTFKLQFVINYWCLFTAEAVQAKKTKGAEGTHRSSNKLSNFDVLASVASF